MRDVVVVGEGGAFFDKRYNDIRSREGLIGTMMMMMIMLLLLWRGVWCQRETFFVLAVRVVSDAVPLEDVCHNATTSDVRHIETHQRQRADVVACRVGGGGRCDGFFESDTLHQQRAEPPNLLAEGKSVHCCHTRLR